MIVTVTPIYGNGWTDGSMTIDEPSTFQVEAEPDYRFGDIVRGTVVTQNHILFGYKFSAAPRHNENDGAYTCTLSKPNTVGDEHNTFSGYCIVNFR